jgi:hypothetical protein
MVSSTFYDLRQIRADLVHFLVDEVGFVPLLSELASFPVDPDVDTVENCRRRVEHDADALILIIGGRYGTVDSKTSRTITNLEYLAARSKGIPIFAFIDKAVLALTPVWLKNKDADFTSVVDDARIFEFVNEVRSVHKVWTHAFETAQDIVEVLRPQFARLTLDGIRWARQLRESSSGWWLTYLRGRAVRIALERPTAWEYRLFAQALTDEVDEVADLRRRYEIGVTLGTGEYLSVENFLNWASARIAQLRRIADAINVLMNETLQTALGPPGQPGDPELIVFTARQVGACYKEALEWTDQVRRTTAEERLLPVVRAMASFSNDIIAQIAAFGPHCLAQIERGLAEAPTSEPRTLKLSLVVKLSGLEEYERRMEELHSRL